MEKVELDKRVELDPIYRSAMKLFILTLVGAIAFTAGLLLSKTVHAEAAPDGGKPKVIYPKKTTLDFEGAAIEGELRNPGEFYFQHRPEDKMESLVKRRKNFHQELLRDAVMSK